MSNFCLRKSWALTVLALATALPGCAGMRHADRGALMGTTVGALAGGIIGHQSGNTGAGAVLGAGAGMITGALIGDAEDAREERDAAMAHVRQVEYERRIAEPPLTNNDLIFMCQNGLSDEVIVNAVKTRGGEFDLDPAALVTLKHNGVRDSLIARIQTMGGSRIRPTRPAASYVSAPPPRVVIVEPMYSRPPPVATFHFGTGPHYGHWHHCHHW